MQRDVQRDVQRVLQRGTQRDIRKAKNVLRDLRRLSYSLHVWTICPKRQQMLYTEKNCMENCCFETGDQIESADTAKQRDRPELYREI